MRDLVKVIAWIFLVISGIAVVVGVFSFLAALNTSTSSPYLYEALMVIGAGFGGLLLSGTSLVIVELATRMTAESVKAQVAS